jgi:S1-C subfamily serine protease
MIRRLWLVFCQTATICIAVLFVLGRVTRGWIGVGVQDMTRELSESLRLPEIRGALITEVVRGTRAEKAGYARETFWSPSKGSPSRTRRACAEPG